MMHFVVVAPRGGRFEPSLSGMDAAELLGLPLAGAAGEMELRVTLLHHGEWLDAEARGEVPADWNMVPGTRLHAPATQAMAAALPGFVRAESISLSDPWGAAGAHGPWSPRARDIMANSDTNLFLSWCLSRHLESLHRRDAITAVFFPQYGGLGYVPLLLRASQAPGHLAVPMLVVATGAAGDCWKANLEGEWSKPAQHRRMMEDWSMALADAVIAYGPRAAARAMVQRADGAAGVRVIRRTLPAEIELHSAPAHEGATIRISGALCGAFGAQAALDAARDAAEDAGYRILATAPDCLFPPQFPRSFRDYWSTRGWVKNLVAKGRWAWDAAADDQVGAEFHVAPLAATAPVWRALDAGILPLMSADTADGWVDETTAAELGTLAPVESADVHTLGRLAAAFAATSVDARNEALEILRLAARKNLTQANASDPAFITLLQDLVSGALPAAPRLGQVAALSMDRTQSLAANRAEMRPLLVPEIPELEAGKLSVIVTCYEMGDMVREAVETLWNSEHRPDDIIVVDDGSTGPATLAALEGLRERAQRDRLPFRVLRQQNGGLPAARNAGMRAVRTEFLAFFDGDNMIHPWFLGAALACIQREPELGGVAAWDDFAGDGVENTGWNCAQAEFPLFLAENLVFVPFVTRTALVRALEGNDPLQRFNYEDWEFTVRVAASGWPIVVIPAPAQDYRIRPDSLLRTMNPVQHLVMRERFLSQHADLARRFAIPVALMAETSNVRAEKECVRLNQVVYELEGRLRMVKASLTNPLLAAKGIAKFLKRRLLG